VAKDLINHTIDAFGRIDVLVSFITLLAIFLSLIQVNAAGILVNGFVQVNYILVFV
jgi:hypothetical protein